MGKPRTEEQKAARRATKKANRKNAVLAKLEADKSARELDARMAQERERARQAAAVAERNRVAAKLAVGSNILDDMPPALKPAPAIDRSGREPYMIFFGDELHALAGLFDKLLFVENVPVSRVRGAAVERTLLVVRERVPGLWRMGDVAARLWQADYWKRWDAMNLSKSDRRFICTVVTDQNVPDFNYKCDTVAYLITLHQFQWLKAFITAKSGQQIVNAMATET